MMAYRWDEYFINRENSFKKQLLVFILEIRFRVYIELIEITKYVVAVKFVFLR